MRKRGPVRDTGQGGICDWGYDNALLRELERRYAGVYASDGVDFYCARANPTGNKQRMFGLVMSESRRLVSRRRPCAQRSNSAAW